MLAPGVLHRHKWNAPIERHKCALPSDGKGEQIDVGQLLVTASGLGIELSLVEQRDIVIPELVLTAGSEGSQRLHESGNRNWMSSSRCPAGRPKESVFGQRT